MLSEEKSLTNAIISFCQFVRSNGLKNGIEETLVALDAASLGSISDEKILRHSLKFILCTSIDEFKKFNTLFDIFWLGKSVSEQRSPYGSMSYPINSNKRKTIQEHYNDLIDKNSNGKANQVLGASTKESFNEIDFGKISDENVAEMEKIAVKIWQNMASRMSKKLTIYTPTKNKIDLRRSIRKNLSRGSDLVYLEYRGKVRKKRNIVVLLDISGSMEKYTYFYILFMSTLQNSIDNVRSFTFSTKLNDITDLLQKSDITEIFKEIHTKELSWHGGTHISICLRQFNELYLKNTIKRDTIVVIISDGLDTGDPELFYSELKIIKERSKKLIWINPLKGMEEYEPLTKGINKVLPLLDGFISGHNLSSLEELEVHITNAA